MSKNQPIPFNRNLVILGAILIQLALGAIYAWSVFTQPLVEAGWSKIQTQVVFSVSLLTFAIVMILAGKLMKKVQPRLLTQSGAILLGFAYILTGLIAGTNPLLITLLIGVMGGAGIGLAYVVPISVGMKWFPDKKGLITGLGVAGFGFGATLWVKLAGSWGKLLSNFGLSKTFLFYGITFLIFILLGSRWMVNPKEEKGKKNNAKSIKTEKISEQTVNLTSKEMLKTPQYLLIFLTFMFSASAGLMTIGLMKLFPQEALLANNSLMTPERASAIAGTAMAVFFSLANGLGRIIWGWLSDKLGRKKSVILMTSSQAIFVFLFQRFAANPNSLYLLSTLIGFNFGGNFALFPTLTADIFGIKYLAENYAWVFLAYGLGGILGPILGGKLGDLNNFPLAFTICSILCIVASVLTASLKKVSIQTSSNDRIK